MQVKCVIPSIMMLTTYPSSAVRRRQEHLQVLFSTQDIFTPGSPDHGDSETLNYK